VLAIRIDDYTWRSGFHFILAENFLIFETVVVAKFLFLHVRKKKYCSFTRGPD